MQVKAFNKVIQMDPKSLRGYYWLGLIYFNQGYEAQKKADAMPLSDGAGYKAALLVADDFFKQALPYFEKGYEIDKNDPQLLVGLGQIYYRFKMTEKSDAIKKQIEAKK